MHIITDYDKLIMNINNNVIISDDLNSKHNNWGSRVINDKYERYISITKHQKIKLVVKNIANNNSDQFTNLVFKKLSAIKKHCCTIVLFLSTTVLHKGLLFKLKVTNTPRHLFNAAGVPTSRFQIRTYLIQCFYI